MNWKNLASPRKVARALEIETRTLSTLTVNGIPDTLLQFLGGLGDELLLTCVAREMRRRRPALRIWQVSPLALLLRGNPDYHRVFDDHLWWLRHSKPQWYCFFLISAFESPSHSISILINNVAYKRKLIFYAFRFFIY